MSEASTDLRLKQIDVGDRLTGLSLGHAEFAPLKTFVQKKAWKFEQQSLARTYGMFDAETSKLKAYMTLVCGEVAIEEGDEPPIPADEGRDYPYRHFPAVKIARLAVDSRLRKSGVGRYLVEVALGIAKGTICPAVGCRFMMVDAKKASIKFYEKCGFTTLDTGANKARLEPVMFIDLGKIAA